MQVRLFNKALYEVGDNVRSRHTDGRITGEVEKEELITNKDGLQYQIIWVGGTFHSAWDFEPVNPKERKLYYAEYAKHGIKAKNLTSSGGKGKKRKQLTLNLNKAKGDEKKN